MIATEKGYNLYVCGNGGAKPRHADLLAADLDEETCLKYIDRFLMYYVTTADRLTRTCVWLEKLPGGIDHLRDVVIHDKLEICDDLEAMMQRVVDTYRCEWKEVVEDPEKRKFFEQFVNTDETEPCIEFVGERGQTHPAPWPDGLVQLDAVQVEAVQPEAKADRVSPKDPSALRTASSHHTWVRVGKVDDFPIDGGAAVRYGYAQLAVFRFDSRGEWYATQNMCPHKREFVLSRGMIGDAAGTPKVACHCTRRRSRSKRGLASPARVMRFALIP